MNPQPTSPAVRDASPTSRTAGWSPVVAWDLSQQRPELAGMAAAGVVVVRGAVSS